jgi:phosphoglycerate kinase
LFDCIGQEAENAAATLKQEKCYFGKLTFPYEEEAGDVVFAKQLASLGDIYVNDALNCSERTPTTIMAFFESKMLRIIIIKEIESLNKVKQ